MRRNSNVKLTARGKAAVTVAAVALVLLAMNGFAPHVTALVFGVWTIVAGHWKRVAAMIPTARQSLRALCWVVVAVAAYAATQGLEAPGGPQLGLALATGLAVALHLTRRSA